MAKRIDISNQRFGKLTVIERADDYISPKGKHESCWKCKCDCGNMKTVRQSDLHSGRTKSCGICVSYIKELNRNKNIPNGHFRDYTNEKFGRWTVQYFVKKNSCGASIWHCKCDCGTEKDLTVTTLVSGYSKSCGCLRDETTSKLSTSHGMSKTRLYKEWIAMKDRCYRKSHEFYEYYGGKGIKICNEWKNSFENFRDWALQNGYEDDLTIDRIDNDKDYCPSNCRWVDLKFQANNRTNNILVFYGDEWISVEKVMEQTGKTYNQVYHYYRYHNLMKRKQIFS